MTIDNQDEMDTGSTLALVAREATPVPAGITSEEAEELKQRAAAAVAQLKEADGSKELTVIDSITAVGMRSQRQAGGDLELLRARVGDLIGKDADGTGGRVSNDLKELRLALSRIDPNKVAQESVMRRVIHVLPFGRNQLMRALETIAVRYEPVAKQVALIEVRLREGRMLLSRDNIELRKLYEQVEAQQAVVHKNCYLAELLMQELDALLLETTEPRKRERVENALFDVSIRAQDLRTMAEADEQLFVGIEMTRQNNSRLGQAVDRSLTLVGNIVMVGLAIQSALARQRRVLEATRQTREFLGDLLVANASAIKQHTQEIGDIYTSPLIAMEKIERAHHDLLDAIDSAERLRADGIAAARDNIKRLTALAGEMDVRRGDVKALTGPTFEA
jgi:uncharacterized protein YaaN involved in tellurite resistance